MRDPVLAYPRANVRRMFFGPAPEARPWVGFAVFVLPFLVPYVGCAGVLLVPIGLIMALAPCPAPTLASMRTDEPALYRDLWLAGWDERRFLIAAWRMGCTRRAAYAARVGGMSVTGWLLSRAGPSFPFAPLLLAPLLLLLLPGALFVLWNYRAMCALRMGGNGLGWLEGPLLMLLGIVIFGIASATFSDVVFRGGGSPTAPLSLVAMFIGGFLIRAPFMNRARSVRSHLRSTAAEWRTARYRHLEES